MDLQEIKKSLPNGAINEIVKRTGISQATISQVLNGKAKSRHQTQILQATADYLREYRQKEQKALNELKEIIKA